MQAVILAGGLGTRISEESQLRPKPMIEIGGKPILWHIMKIYSSYGINDFIICAGYKSYMIKEYFSNYFLHNSNVTFNLKDNIATILQINSEPWNVTVIDTGEFTMTGGRLKRIEPYITEETFCFTYGDGVSNIDINKLIQFHQCSQTLATVTAIKPPGRYGALKLNDSKVESFEEKPQGDGMWINGGFFILNKSIFKYIKDDHTIWENEPLINLAADKQLSAYKHFGFWQAMDTLRDKILLENYWNNGNIPWKSW